MADFRSSEIINKPVHEVFNYMVTMENAPELMPYVVKVEKQTEGEIGRGTKFIETRMVRGKNIKADVEIIDFEKDKTYTTRSNANGLITEYKYAFHEIEEGTQVEMEANVKTSGLVAKLTKRFIVNIVKQEDGSQLQYLKEMLEK
ncbi:SRPBCC family protein [Cytobacillus oceanisediminis]|uniref:Polyketide cyclase/dehydrase/lipid transport protein n=1 Tax=Cytobacillus oceanisediminis TaxID=665099 RepID=A0A562JFG6_9BACI|nr:SRPBCC family protein [Cytobacillus oceanisediminis]TWH81976.1 polyketide cyclase/dehydrase/lipid transport protein [Cytobacillus oceanisediminis]